MSLAIAIKPSPDHHNKKRHDSVHEAMRGSHTVYPNPHTPVIQLKSLCPCDGGCPRCTGVIQPKLTIGQPNDVYEQEADRVAEQVMTAPEAGVQRKCVNCDDQRVPAAPDKPAISPFGNNALQRQPEEEETLQAKSDGGCDACAAPTHVKRYVRSMDAGGEPLPGSVRGFFESRFGRDFSRVRIHNDAQSHVSARAISARAFTHGHNVVFAPGQYAPQGHIGQRLLAHELTHMVQQTGGASANTIQRQPALSQAQRNQLCYQTGANQPQPDASQPDAHPTYESWLDAFRGISHFTSNDTVEGHTTGSRFKVLGTRARRYGDTSATQETRPVPVTGRLRTGEEFIDHPTNQWVENCLPPNLRATAYHLPSDCADIAVILRHVWLAAHHRTETSRVAVLNRREGGTTMRNIVVGDEAGRANKRRASGLIRDIFSGNVASLVNPYADARGNALQNDDDVLSLLHPGDILVWEHRKKFVRDGRVRSRRTGGHTQTIVHVERSGDQVSRINVLQGNQPIFRPAAEDILQTQGAANTDPDSPAGMALRNLPGRRVELSNSISIANIPDPETGQTVWGRIDKVNGAEVDYTVIVTAGPSRSAPRPAAQRVGRQRIRQISDWFTALRTETVSRLYGVVEAALSEARAIIDGNGSVRDADAEALGRNAGENLWSRATAAVSRLAGAGWRTARALLHGDVGNRFHFEPLHRIRAAIRALGGIEPLVYHGNPAARNQVRDTFTIIDREFDFAARGGSSITFNRRVRQGGELVKVVVSGFDPFGNSPPQAGDWNPAGAAAMALDNTQVGLGGRDKAAVESVVYPVSFQQLDRGIVERVVRTSQADAILTVSLDPNIAAGSSVQIEQFAAGVRNLRHLQTHRLFPPEQPNPNNAFATQLRGVPPGGPALTETTADLSGIAADMELRTRDQRGKERVVIQAPTIERDVTLRFPGRAAAQQAIQALGLTQAVTGNEVTLTDAQAIRRILAGATRISDTRGVTAGIVFTLGNQRFTATVVKGPGGSFLSNEVAYRTQRELQQQGSQAVSFHTHVPPPEAAGSTIPQTGSTQTRRGALWAARNAIKLLVDTLRRMIRAVGTRIVAQRRQSGSGNPP